MVTSVVNKAVVVMVHKIMVVAMKVVMEMVAVVVVTVAVVLAVVETIKDVVGLATALTPNIGMACPERSILLS